MSVEKSLVEKNVFRSFESAFSLQEHTKVSDEKKERGDKWDQHTRKRPGSDEKKKDPKKGWVIRKTPPKDKTKRENGG